MQANLGVTGRFAPNTTFDLGRTHSAVMDSIPPEALNGVNTRRGVNEALTGRGAYPAGVLELMAEAVVGDVGVRFEATG